MTDILNQLARTFLLPTDLSERILSGNPPPLSDVLLHVVIAAMDADAVTANDRSATWVQKRMSRQLLGLTFLTAIMAASTTTDSLQIE